MIDISVLNKLNVSDASERLENLRSLVKDADFPAVIPEYINNHIHTTYSLLPRRRSIRRARGRAFHRGDRRS